MKPVLTGTMSDLQVLGWGVLSCIGGRGWGVSPSCFVPKKKIKFKNDKGFSFYFSFVFLLGGGGVSPLYLAFFLKNKRPTLIFARKEISRYPIGWIDCHVKVDQGRNESV